MRLSERAQRRQLSPLQGFFRKAKERKGVISLAVGELNFATPVHIKMAGVEAIQKDITKYTPAGGMAALRKAAAVDFQKTGISSATADNTIVSGGSQRLLKEAISVLCNPGDEILIPLPGYPAYWNNAFDLGVETIFVDTGQDEFVLRSELVKRYISPRTKAIIINSPCNPTGVIWDVEELWTLAEEAPQLYFIVDEAYHRIVYKRCISFASLPKVAERTITIRSASKTYTMSGWRIGWLTGPYEAVEKIEIGLEASTVSACSISQFAALAALEGPQLIVRAMVKELDERRQYLMEWLDNRSVYCPIPQGAFYAFANLPKRFGLTSTELAELLLEEAKVAVTPGLAFGGEKYDGFIRISYAPVSLARLQEALERIDKVLRLK